jgi:hypothetical protein
LYTFLSSLFLVVFGLSTFFETLKVNYFGSAKLLSGRISRYFSISFPEGSVADPHRKNADADPGKNLSADADPDLCSY